MRRVASVFERGRAARRKPRWLAAVIGTLAFGVGSTGASAQTLDWDVETWPSGSLSNVYNVGGGNTTLTISGATASFNAPAPEDNKRIPGGLAVPEDNLDVWVNHSSAGQFIRIDIDFEHPGGVTNIDFTMFDIDFGSRAFRDRVVVTAYNGNSINPSSVTTGPNARFDGVNAVTGRVSTPSTSGAANARFIFNQRGITRVTIIYLDVSGRPNPSQQWIGLHDIGFEAEPDLVTLSGTVFEDANYGGGAGRDLAAAAGVGRPGARVELYDNVGVFVRATTTAAGGTYSFSGLLAGYYTVRVVNDSVSSARTGYTAALKAVQTYRTDASSGSAVAVTDYVGGQDPSVADAALGGSGATMNTSTGVFGAGPSGTAQSITNVTVSASDITGVDFGYSFDVIVNTNDAGQGSLRQFITNANALGGEGSLAQNGNRRNLNNASQSLPAGYESSIFMIPDGSAHAGLRAGLANQLSGGVAVIGPGTLLPAITGASTVIDGTTQTVNVGDTNAGTLGTGGVVGVGGLSLPAVSRPEVQLNDSGVRLARGLDVQSANVTIRGLAIYGFANNRATGVGEANIRVGAVSGAIIEQNIVGTTATSFSDPGAARTLGDNLVFQGASGAIVRNNLIGYASYMGALFYTSSVNALVEGNEIRGNGIGHANQDGVSFEGNSGSGTVRGNLIADGEGTGVDMPTSSGSNTVVNNTITGNGIGTDASLESPGVRVTGNANRIELNIINANFGAGVMVRIASAGNTITKNSIFANGTITNKVGGGPSGQIGIDLLSATDAPKTGTAPFRSLNDAGDADSGGNGRFNFPLLASARSMSGNMVISGYARPGSLIELFISDSDPSGFGEGETYLLTLTEGGTGAGGTDPYVDTDTGTGTYGPGAINGIPQGTDNTNKFSFTLPIPGGVSAGARLTATATLGGGTSEFSGVVIVATAQPTMTLVEGVTPSGTQPPGTDLVYTAAFANIGTAAAESLVMTNPIPANTDFKVGSESHDLGTTGLTVVVEYSDDDGSSWTYTPVSAGGGAPTGYDRAVTDVRWTFTGALSEIAPNNTGTTSVTMRIR